MKTFDAHIHFPLGSSTPYEDLANELRENNVYDFLLILNSKQELNLYRKNRERFMLEGFSPRLALILNIHADYCFELFDSLNSLDTEYSVKIHPRLSNITTSDFAYIRNCLERLNYRNIIVDNWYYGPQLKNHIGLELSIYLADKLPDKKIIIAHAGGLKLLETMLYTRPLKNVYYDLALTEIYFDTTSLSKDIDHFLKYTKNRIMFGSDYPDFHIKQSRDALLTHCKNAAIYTPQTLENIFYETAKSIYG